MIVPRGLRQAATVVLLALAALFLPASAAQAALLLPEDQQILVDNLAAAYGSQGICYGWNVTITGAGGGVEQGSNLGVGVPVTPGIGACTRYLILEANLDYTSATSESSDSARLRFTSNIGTPTQNELGVGENDFVGDDEDKALFTAVAALPIAAAEMGAAPYVEATPDAVVKPASDTPDSDGGSDVLRENGVLIAFAVVALLAGAGLLAFSFHPASSGTERRWEKWARSVGDPRGDPRGPGPAPGGTPPGGLAPGPGAPPRSAPPAPATDPWKGP